MDVSKLPVRQLTIGQAGTTASSLSKLPVRQLT